MEAQRSRPQPSAQTPIPRGGEPTQASKAQLIRQAGAQRPQGPVAMPAAKGDDDLEIPAFLRRQAN